MQIKTQIHRTKYAEIFFDEEGILWLVPDINAEMDLEEIKACFDVYRELGVPNNKVLQIIDAKGNATMSLEARNYVAENGRDFFIASAVISTNLTVRLIVNFFNIFYKNQVVPFKMFDSEKSARAWLSKFRS